MPFSKEGLGSKGEAGGGQQGGKRGYRWPVSTGSKLGVPRGLSSANRKSRASPPTTQQGSREPWVSINSRPANPCSCFSPPPQHNLTTGPCLGSTPGLVGNAE